MKHARDHRNPAAILVSRAVAPVAIVLAILAFGVAFAQGRVVDDLGREIVLDASPLRIVTMVPTHTETVCALGACDRLVGVDSFSNVPAEVSRLPDLGSAFDADLEALIALEPDLVLTDEYSGLAEALVPLGIPVYAGTPQTVAEVWSTTEALATLLGLESEAALLIGRAQGRVEALSASVAGLPAPRVFVELDATPYSVGPGSYLGELLTLARADNIVPGRLGDFPQVDPELVVAEDPQVMILLDAPFGESAETVAARPGWGSLSAVRDGAVIELDQASVDLLTRAGPRLPDALELLIELLREVRP
ncbi:MAG: ABC transporter substrate-binding protein [Trueperaceae bacterium]|nr:ABC transporter substrate-binding protein [Trueperaceae bacterium]